VTRPHLLCSLVSHLLTLHICAHAEKLGDSTRSGGDSAQKEGGSVLESAQQGLSNAGQAVSDTLSGATGQKK
jgi:hypothetical protein